MYNELLEAYFQVQKQLRTRKRIHYSCEGRIEKSVPCDHRLASLDKPRDAKRLSSGRIFLSYPHTHDRFLFIITEEILILSLF